MKTSILMIMLTTAIVLAGCGDDSASPQSGTVASATVQQAIDKAVSQGKIPNLDRTSSVAGVDADKNGVRDDIDAYINSLNYSTIQKAALRQASSSITLAITSDFTNSTSVQTAGDLISNSVHCIYSTFDGDTAREMVHNIEKYTINTRQRVDAYLKLGEASNGKEFSVPRTDTCDQKFL